jgi:serine/threonine protein kinase
VRPTSFSREFASMANSEPRQNAPQIMTTAFYGRGGFAPPAPTDLGAQIPGLDVLEVLGHGGMGVVYKGRQPLLDRLVAIKVLRPDFQADDGFQERFLREARTLAKLRHPYIVTVYDVGKSGQLYYLVMEFVEGATLRQLLVDGSISERDTLDFVPQIAEALEHAHENGVVHRDIKPENVLIDPRGRVRLVDFGLATLFGPRAQERSPDDNCVAGTLGYMAPEQLTSPESVDHRADIYSTGVVFYEMLAHALPTVERSPPSSKAGTDPRFDPIVLRALERERERRYQQARLMHADIVALTRTPESTLRVEQYIPAPPDQVFEAWTNPLTMGDWYAPSDEFGPTSAEVDVQIGGAYQVRMYPPGQDQPSVVSGQYCRVDGPRVLSFTWAWESPRVDTHETQITLEFHPRGEGTGLVLTHERFRDQELRDRHAHGWKGCLSRLARKWGG